VRPHFDRRRSDGATSITRLWRRLSDSRVNILVLGIDQREGMTDPARTDTMLLFTLDRQARTVGMLSINRDLW
jgi:anionic cell wall polymer biosynthesis LytR-Cps2A-Psr (LCP) family protein